jgi:oligopeptide/dipeptide ABC transporter ATP-binding protein
MPIERNPPAQGEQPILELDHVSRRFSQPLDALTKITNRLGITHQREQVVHAVNDVSLKINRGEVVGLAGESGCGKSTLGRIAAGILDPSSGAVRYEGTPVSGLNGKDSRAYQLAVQMIFQDPFTCLNPRMKVQDIIGEAAQVHGIVRRSEVSRYVDTLLEDVRMLPAAKSRYPHQFSGGQRQRIGIARALAVRPKVLICDESVAALDVSIQAQVLNLFLELKQRLDLTYLFISHDLGVIRHLTDRTVIMYLGRIVEEGPTEDVFRAPNHPYTRGLLSGVLSVDSRRKSFQSVKGELPSPLNPPSGCAFHPRCPHAMPVCKDTLPTLVQAAPGHRSACHLNGPAAAATSGLVDSLNHAKPRQFEKTP